MSSLFEIGRVVIEKKMKMLNVSDQNGDNIGQETTDKMLSEKLI